MAPNLESFPEPSLVSAEYMVNSGWLLVGWTKDDQEVYLSVSPERQRERLRFRTHDKGIYAEDASQVRVKHWAPWLAGCETKHARHAKMKDVHREVFSDRYENGKLKQTRKDAMQEVFLQENTSSTTGEDQSREEVASKTLSRSWRPFHNFEVSLDGDPRQPTTRENDEAHPAFRENDQSRASFKTASNQEESSAKLDRTAPKTAASKVPLGSSVGAYITIKESAPRSRKLPVSKKPIADESITDSDESAPAT